MAAKGQREEARTQHAFRMTGIKPFGEYPKKRKPMKSAKKARRDFKRMFR